MRYRTVLIEAALITAAALDTFIDMWSSAPVSVVFGVIGCVILPLRHLFPRTVFALTLPAALLEAALVGPFVALYVLATRSRDRRVLAACAVLFAIASAAPSPFGDEPVDAADTLVYLAYGLGTAAVPVLLGQLVLTRRELSRRIEEIEEAKEHERVLHAQAILAQERAQLAREMHDVVSHQVSLIAVQAGALQMASAEPATREAARTIRALSVGTLDELRIMVTLLRASGTTELSPQPTLADLQTLVANSGIAAELTGEPAPTVGTPGQRAIYRTVQEALTNVRKHAPGASATVELWQSGPHTGVTITNSRPSRPALPLPGAGQGLVGLHERACLLNGVLESGPTPDGGYRVHMMVPLN
ncbi:sensor histidine kinase [Actinoplanes derwentensis]|uniref:histidine kinase n=1 Tax=Actinoplanes derwentensis TaxID=113562 RepID=A0A1H1TS26_9ACTN|nr:sensor histidine kinase [Actinoplanes derwentensis]GID85103.1 two-component sensor histidine kinase [Actinoplanes derwentensis]SDS62389.1 Signal transduction histidine kinase [Actinoplanes derwentensis]